MSSLDHLSLLFIALVSLLATPSALATSGEKPRDIDYTRTPPAPAQQTEAAAKTKNAGCLSCHTETDQLTMHANPGVIIGCTDCHGGDASVRKPEGIGKGGPEYQAALDKAHVQPRYPEFWHYPSSASPPRSYTMLNMESQSSSVS